MSLAGLLSAISDDPQFRQVADLAELGIVGDGAEETGEAHGIPG